MCVKDSKSRYWRYNGYLVRYAVTISDNTREFDSTLPSAVLVHGFGARLLFVFYALEFKRQ